MTQLPGPQQEEKQYQPAGMTGYAGLGESGFGTMSNGWGQLNMGPMPPNNRQQPSTGLAGKTDTGRANGVQGPAHTLTPKEDVVSMPGGSKIYGTNGKIDSNGDTGGQSGGQSGGRGRGRGGRKPKARTKVERRAENEGEEAYTLLQFKKEHGALGIQMGQRDTSGGARNRT
jgi:hypothetical protein